MQSDIHQSKTTINLMMPNQKACWPVKKFDNNPVRNQFNILLARKKAQRKGVQENSGQKKNHNKPFFTWS
jgi:hypothetical protein